MTTDQKKLIFSFLLNSNLPTFRWYGYFLQNVPFAEYMSGVCALYSKTTYLNLKDLANANEKSVHQKCIEFLLIEVYKYLNDLSSDIMNTIFKPKQNTLNLRNFHAFEFQKPKTKAFVLDSIAYSASQFWKNNPEKIRNSASFSIFKESI